ncbi:apextrin-like protein 1 [Elysia marginata]|uniref:Apextrin-like protein 1 n=1 Tax=Elysia marginata TaxID=1093978 RepID=A0AAV4EIB4_9GAST|nr:apextrin-like protein 1 [Elysia marginata]
MVLYQVSVLASLLVLHWGLAVPIQDVSDPSMPFQLTVSPGLVNRYTTEEMSLRCGRNPSVPTKLAEIFRIRIAKQSPSGWDLVAEQRDNVDRPTVVGNVTASARLKGNISDVFLKISCDVKGQDCFGVFKCNVMGFDTDDDARAEKSSTLKVYKFKNFMHHLISVSEDTEDKMLEIENFTDTAIARLNNGFQRLAKSVQTNQSTFDSRLDSLKARMTQQEISIDTEISEIKERLTEKEEALCTNQSVVETRLSKIETLQSDLEKFLGNFVAATRTNQSLDEHRFDRIESNQVSHEDRLAKLESMLESLSYWPAGHYALLRPKSGCPTGPAFSGDTQSYLKLHAESQSSSSQGSSHSSAFSGNTKSTVDSKDFVTLEFCEVTIEFNTARWPQGSFCVHKLLDQSCPAGFTDGHVYFDTEDTDDSTEVRTNAAAGTKLYFCCQNATSAYVPIQLPTHSPFLLYRFGGVCQAVQGMSVSQEYVQINTEDDSNNDYLRDWHPDIDQPGPSAIKLNLCYYKNL